MVALFDASDAYHHEALEFARRSPRTWISSMAAVTEVMYVLSESRQAQRNLLAWLHRGGVKLEESDPADFQRIDELMEKYADLPMDFTDAVLVALCERLRIRTIASIDKHFKVYRYRGQQPFRNLFFGRSGTP